MRPPSHELHPENYPFSCQIMTRLGDTDPLNHINNVRITQLFEEGREIFIRHLQTLPTPITFNQTETRLTLASTLVNYLAEVFYPDRVDIYSGITLVGKQSILINSLMLQGNKPVAHCRASMVYTFQGITDNLPDIWHSQLQPFFLSQQN